MRVFLAGAGGAIGRSLLPRLIEAGHEVTGMSRSEQRAEAIRSAGAEALVCDVFDAPALAEGVAAAEPEVVVHELTSLPDRIDLRNPEYGPNNRIRREGTRNLLAAASAAGARRVVAQSISFMYAPVGGTVKDEEAPLMSGAEGSFGESVDATVSLEEQVTGAEGIEGLVLRYGWFYGPGTYFGLDGSTAEDVRRRRFPIVGQGSGISSFIHIDDAAGATVAAVERGAPGIYNVVDDEPAPMREWVPVYAEAIGAKRPLRVPAWLARLLAGKQAVAMATGLRGASNAKAKAGLGWEPSYPSWRQGFREGLSP
ncbi:MAG: NAD-dependent epimerase/dehydratase family protein [Solirubrobacterales bacterium]